MQQTVELLQTDKMAHILWLNNTPNDVIFSNEYTAVFRYDGVHNIGLGTHVMYSMTSDWWGYVGKVIATVIHNFTTEFIVQYDNSIAGFANTTDAYKYFE
jgi:hypothetical protein